jgi:hypothetical protein
MAVANTKMTKTTVRGALSLALATLILHLILVQPNHPAALAWNGLLLFALELPTIVLAMIALGRGTIGFSLRVVLVAAIIVIALLKAADFGMFTALNREFNFVGDLPLIASFYDLIVGTTGEWAAFGAVVLSLAAIVIVTAASWWALRRWSRLDVSTGFRRLAGVAAVFFAALVIVDVGAKTGRWTSLVAYPGTAFTARVGVERLETARDTIADLRLFQQAAANDPFADQSGLFDLVDRDVIVVFVESYGRTSFDTPFYSGLHRQTLLDAETKLAALGLDMASTFIRSPTKGGQSWLAHSTFANGLWVADQSSYRAVLASNRQTLFHYAQQSGFRTAAVMPQITIDWPESAVMGFDVILAEHDLGYAGKRFNWITMPDQFTFAAMDRLLRDAPREEPNRPLFIQMALGSSHAPWVPVPDVIAWEELGDGTVFNPTVSASDPPHIVWQDNDRVRAQYRLAVDYALQTVFAYAALHADDPPLMIIIGDHQAAGFVALDDRPDVPMHIVGPKSLVDLVADADFNAGLIPPTDTVVRRMDVLRGHLINALSSISVDQAAQ